MAVTLPAIASVNPGWSMGFATDNGKGMTVTAPTGSIVSGGKIRLDDHARRRQLRISAAAVRRQQLAGRLVDAQHAACKGV